MALAPLIIAQRITCPAITLTIHKFVLLAYFSLLFSKLVFQLPPHVVLVTPARAADSVENRVLSPDSRQTAKYSTAALSSMASSTYPPKVGLLPPVTNSLIPYTSAQIDQMLAGTKNPATLKTLMKCESQNTDVVRPDSNGLESYGLLQFNGTSTWNEFAPLAGVSSTPVNPTAAIKVADYMISHGYLARWTCAKITGLIK